MAESTLNSTRTAGKVFISVATKDEEENDREDHDVHHECHEAIKCADYNVKGDPRDQKPASPVAAVKHEHSGNDLKEAREMNVPMTFEICERQTAAEEGDAAEDYKEPTDDRDR